MATPIRDQAMESPELVSPSFEPNSNAQKAWLSLAQRRRDEVRRGKVAMVPGDEALARVKARIA
ncbi:MAG: addiction module protein [Casimicrobiaceae bacterium]